MTGKQSRASEISFKTQKRKRKKKSRGERRIKEGGLMGARQVKGSHQTKIGKEGCTGWKKQKGRGDQKIVQVRGVPQPSGKKRLKMN